MSKITGVSGCTFKFWGWMRSAEWDCEHAKCQVSVRHPDGCSQRQLALEKLLQSAHICI